MVFIDHGSTAAVLEGKDKKKRGGVTLRKHMEKPDMAGDGENATVMVLITVSLLTFIYT